MAEVTPHHPDPARASRALTRVARIAVLSILLGFVMQALILAVRLTGGPWGTDILVQMAGNVSWAVLVCTGVGIGTAVANARPLLSGALAAVFAPASLAIAKAAQKAMAGWLGAVQSEAVLSLGTLSLLRAVEYGLLGWFLGGLVKRDEDRPGPYLRTGLALSLTFGAGITVLTGIAAQAASRPFGPPELATAVLNEMVFPVGCALVIFLGQDVGRHLRSAQG